MVGRYTASYCVNLTGLPKFLLTRNPGRLAQSFIMAALLALPGRIMNKRRRRRLPYVPAMLLFGSIVQSSPSLLPPDQTYIYDSTTATAVAPVTPALNLSATYSIEFWITLNPYVQDAQSGPVFNKGIPNNGDPYAAYNLSLTPGTHQLNYFQSTGSPGSARGAQIGVSLKPGQWYHIAIVSDNLQVRLYLKGSSK